MKIALTGKVTPILRSDFNRQPIILRAFENGIPFVLATLRTHVQRMRMGIREVIAFLFFNGQTSREME